MLYGKTMLFIWLFNQYLYKKGICFALNLSVSERRHFDLLFSSEVQKKTMGRDVTDTFAARSGLAHDVTSRTLRSSLDEKICLVQDGNLRALVTCRSLFLLP